MTCDVFLHSIDINPLMGNGCKGYSFEFDIHAEGMLFY